MREGGVAGTTETAHSRQVAASSFGGEVKEGADNASPALPPHMVDLAKRRSTKLTPEQVARMEKPKTLVARRWFSTPLKLLTVRRLSSHIAVSRWPRGKRCNAW